MAVNRLSQTVASSSTLESSRPAGRTSVPTGAASAVSGTLQKGAIEKFDGLANPFVTVQPAQIERIFAEGSRKTDNAGLVKEHDGKVRLALNSDNVRVMHDEVLRNPKIRERFLQKPGLLQRFGDRVVGFFRNVGSVVGLSDNEVTAHLGTEIERVDGRQRMRLETRGTSQHTGNDEVAGEMRIRRREGLVRSGLRKVFVDSLNTVSGGRWFKNSTTTAVKQQRLDQMRASAQNMAMKMSWFKDGETSEADENFDTFLEADADFLKESNFLGGLREFHEQRGGASADVPAALAAAQALVDAGRKLDGLAPEQVATLRFEFQRLYREELNQELELIDQDPGHQTAQAVFAKGQEFRDLIKAEQARGEQVVAKVRANPDDPLAGAGDRKAFMAGRAERLEKIAKLAAEVRDPDGAFKRMREGRALVRGLLPVVMLHSSDKLQQYLKDQLAGEYTSLLSLSGTKQYYRQAAQAIYEGIVKGVSESLVESLAMNEADRMKDAAKTFVDKFQTDLQTEQDKVWKFAEENFGASLIAANALFLDGDNAVRQREAQAAGHQDIAAKVKAMREELRLQSGDDKLSLSPQVQKTLGAALDRIDRENTAVARSTEHLFDVLAPNGKLQRALDGHEQALVAMLGDGSPGSVQLDKSRLAQIRTQLADDVQGLRNELGALEEELTPGHAAILRKALASAERRMDRACRDVERLADAARGGATVSRPDRLLVLQADMEKLAADVQGGAADGRQRSRNGVLPSARHDAVFKARVENLARGLAGTLKDAAQLAQLYQTNRNEMEAVFRDAPQAPGRTPAQPRIVDALARLDETYRAAEQVVGQHRERVADCALMAGVAARSLSDGYRTDELSRSAVVGQRIVARGLGLDAAVAPRPSTTALAFLANLRSEAVLAAIYDALREEGGEQTAGRLNERFNALVGTLNERPEANDPGAVTQLALRLFGQRDRLAAGLDFIKEALPAAVATPADRALRRQVVDSTLDAVRSNPAVTGMLKSQVPGADLSSNEGLLRAFARVEERLAADSPTRQLVLGSQSAFGELTDAYLRLCGEPRAGEQDGADVQTGYDRLQQAADVFAGRPRDGGDWHRYQARVALDQLLYNVTKTRYGLADLGDQRKDVTAAVSAAVSLRNLEQREDYQRIGQQMRTLVGRIDESLAAGNQERVLMRAPLRQLDKLLEPEASRRLQERLASTAPEDRDYIEKVLNYGAMMTLVDGVLRSDVGGLQHQVAGLNPVDHPELFAAPGQWTIRRPFDFSPLRQQGWSDAQVAAARQEKQMVDDFFRTGGPVKQGSARDLLVARIKAARNIDRAVRREMVALIESGTRLGQEALALLREKTALNRQTADGLKEASERRIQSFENELTAAQQYAMDYQYFDPRSLAFDDELRAKHNRIRTDNPYRYNGLQKLLGLDARRENELLAEGYTAEDLQAFRRLDAENANAVIRRIGGQAGAMRRGLEVYQFLRSAKMAEVYQRAAQDDGASFRELKALRDAYLDDATRLAREQALRAAVLMQWEADGRPFEAFAADDATPGRVQVTCVRELGMSNDTRSLKDNSELKQQARDALDAARQDAPGTFQRWIDEADQYEGRLLELQRRFETGVNSVLARLETARTQRAQADATDGGLADDALAAMREQTAGTIASYRLSLGGEVFTQAKEIAIQRMQTIAKANGDRTGALSQLIEQARREFTFADGDTWQDVADQATDWIRRAERIATGAKTPQVPGLADVAAAPGGSALTAVARVVDDALTAARRLEEQTATNMVAADFEADMRLELLALNKNRIVAENIERNATAIRLFGGASCQDLLPTVFKPGSVSTRSIDGAAQALDVGARQAIEVLDGIIRNSATAKDTAGQARGTQAGILRGMFVELARIGDAVRNLEDIRASSETLPLIKRVRDEQLLPALGAFKQFMEEADGWAAIPDRSKGLRLNGSADGNLIEALRAGLHTDYAKFVEFAQKSVIGMNENLPGQGSLDEAMDEVGAGDGPVATGASPIEQLPSSLIDFRSDPVDEIAVFLPEYRGLCEQIRSSPGGDTALFQLRNILLDGVAGADFEGAKATAAELLRDLQVRFAPAPAERQVPTLAELGLQPQKTLGDGNCFFNALSDQLPGVPSAEVRRRVTDEMKKIAALAGKPPSGVSTPTARKIADTAKDASFHGTVAWGDDSHAGYVARVFNRPVVLVGRDRALVFERDKDAAEIAVGARLPANALFLVHSGGNHWESAKPVASQPVQPAGAVRAGNAGTTQSATEALGQAAERHDRALHYLRIDRAADALARANVARQICERVDESPQYTDQEKKAAREQMARNETAFLAAFNKKWPGAKLVALESLATLNATRAARAAAEGGVKALERGGADVAALTQAVRVLKQRAPVTALAGKTAVVATDDHVVALQAELALAQHYLKVADDRLEEERAYDAKLRTDKKNADLQKSKKSASLQREVAQKQASERLKSAREYFDALKKSTWFAGREEPSFLVYGARVSEAERAASAKK